MAIRRFLQTVCAFVLSASPGAAQHMIDTYAGGGPDGVPATAAAIGVPTATAVDASGNLYIASQSWRVFKVDGATGVLTVVAGDGTSGADPEGGPARETPIGTITGVAVDASGNVFLCDWSNARIRRVDAVTGLMTTVVGGGIHGGPAVGTPLSGPNGVAVDGAGNVYVADTGASRIVKVTPTGTVSVFAGGSGGGFSGDGGLATDAQVAGPFGVTVNGNDVYIADTGNARIRKVDSLGTITTVAGGGAALGNGGPATSAQLSWPYGVAVSLGNLYIAEQASSRIRRVNSASIIDTVAGTGVAGFWGDGGPATSAKLSTNVLGLSADGSGNVYIADSYNLRVRKVDAASASPTIATVAGNGGFSSGDGEVATKAALPSVAGLEVDAGGNLYLPDGDRIRRIDAGTGVITTVAGPGAAARGYGTAHDAAGNLYIADYDANRVRKVDTLGNASVIAGTGAFGWSGDGGLATSARLYGPTAVALDGAGNVYIADTLNDRVRRVDTSGYISTYAGNGTGVGSPPTPDGTLATAARVWGPTGLAFDASGDIYIAEQYGHRVRKVDAATNVITTVAGGGPSLGDGGPATSAALDRPTTLAFDGLGNLYIAETEGARVRRVDTSGTITTIAGTGGYGFAGDGGPATSALFAFLSPWGVAIDSNGNIYAGDTYNFRVRRIRNRAPVADAGPDQTTFGSFTLDGGGSSDPDGDGLLYTWKEGATVVGSSASVSLSRPPGTYTFTLTVSDGFLSSSSDSVDVTVNGAITVNLYGAGTGTVTDFASISCTSGSSSGCFAAYGGPTLVNLYAAAYTGSVFTGWGPVGVCGGTTSNCTVNVTGTMIVAATFDVASFGLTVSSTSGGAVASDVGGIGCGAACSASFPYGTPVTLTATADPGYRFDTWGGDCAASGSIPTCTLTIDAARSASATFSKVIPISLALSPSNASIGVGQLQPFAVIGTFTDGSTRPMGGSVLESGDQFSCALHNNGTVKCWPGYDPVPGIGTAVSLGAGTSHACAVLANGTVKCWGSNAWGQLGDGTTGNSSPPVAVTGISTATGVVAGNTHNCALLADGTVRCWGHNVSGELGDPATIDNFWPTPLTVAGVSDAIALSAEGGVHTCAVIADGTIRCWGSDARGQLGDGPSSAPFATATTVSGIGDATAVAAGAVHTCALRRDGGVKCWGDDYYGELGDGNFNVGTSSPVAVPGIASAIAIGAGDIHSCALLEGGSVSCWGAWAGGAAPVSATPVTVAGLAAATAIAAGADHTCAVVTSANVKCWGNGGQGQLGVPSTPTATPVTVSGLSDAVPVQWGTTNSSVARMDSYGHAAGETLGGVAVGVTVGGLSASGTLVVVNTGTGAVSVTPVDSATGAAPVTLSFSNVTQAGTTSLTTSSSGPAPPATFAVGSPAVFYELTTTAAYSGPITVCIDYTGITFPGGTPQLFHYENGVWVDRTITPVNPPIVCGSVTSLSPFALFGPADLTPPKFSRIGASPNVLWPANHRMVPVFVDVVAVDDQDPRPSCGIVSVASNEDVNGTGDGDTAPDWNVTAPLALQLRAERSGRGNGRVYTLTISCADAAGNAVAGTVTVAVPKDQGKKR
jgi:hypothetical protein